MYMYSHYLKSFFLNPFALSLPLTCSVLSMVLYRCTCDGVSQCAGTVSVAWGDAVRQSQATRYNDIASHYESSSRPTIRVQ